MQLPCLEGKEILTAWTLPDGFRQRTRPGTIQGRHTAGLPALLSQNLFPAAFVQPKAEINNSNNKKKGGGGREGRRNKKRKKGTYLLISPDHWTCLPASEGHVCPHEQAHEHCLHMWVFLFWFYSARGFADPSSISRHSPHQQNTIQCGWLDCAEWLLLLRCC